MVNFTFKRILIDSGKLVSLAVSFCSWELVCCTRVFNALNCVVRACNWLVIAVNWSLFWAAVCATQTTVIASKTRTWWSAMQDRNEGLRASLSQVSLRKFENKMQTQFSHSYGIYSTGSFATLNLQLQLTENSVHMVKEKYFIAQWLKISARRKLLVVKIFQLTDQIPIEKTILL